jgi:protein-S-isoprenylcysteine O-methyltransferase Ste14
MGARTRAGCRAIGRGRILRILLGSAVMTVWLPVLMGGLASLRSRGRLGSSDTLIVTGAYRYVRHPLYAGLSLTLAGLGLLLGRSTLVLGGLGWLLVTQAWSVHEEKDLAQRFGAEYAAYRGMTPRVIPDVGLFVSDVLRDKSRG